MRDYCSLVRDLLPLYIDGLVGDDSVRIIEEHLRQCSDCKDQYEAMGVELKIEEIIAPQAKKPFEKIKRFYVTRTLLAILAFVILAVPTFLAFNSFRGQGTTFTSIMASRNAGRAFNALQDGDYKRVAQFFDTTVQTQEFMEALQDIQSSGVVITSSYLLYNFTTSGHAVFGTVRMQMDYDGELYNTHLSVRFQGGNLTPFRILQVVGPYKNGVGYALPVAEWPKWILQLDQILTPNRSSERQSTPVGGRYHVDFLTPRPAHEFARLPSLNAVPLDLSGEILLYFTMPRTEPAQVFEENVFSELCGKAEAKGLSIAIVAFDPVWEYLD